MLQVRVLPGVQNFISMDIFRQTYQTYIEAIHTRTSSKCKLLLSTTMEEVTRFAIVDDADDDVCVVE